MTSRAFTALLLLSVSLPVMSVAATKPPIVQIAPSADITRVEEYLSGLTTITADFTQTDANGGLASGKFYLKRPGKMRWQYNPPTPILLVSDGEVLTYYDSELQQVNYIGIDDTLAAFLARSHIALNSNSTRLTEFSSAAGVIRATIVQTKKADEGSLTLEFSDAPLKLRQMIVKDSAGNLTHIQLQNAKFGEEISDKLFVFEDPRGPNGGRHKR